MTDVAVLVVGSGSAGMAAALSAREDGAPSVLVAEAEAEGVVGGSSRLSGGLIIGAGTRYQRAFGIDDGPDLRYKQHVPGSSKKQSPHWR
jgi:fumarate reductase flavoprotein subunit